MRAKILLAGALVWSTAASACAEDQVAPPPPGAGAGPKWQLVHEGLPGALLRVWGRNARDVYAVGSDGDGRGPLVLHFDGDAWTRLDTGAAGDLWWIDAAGDDELRMVGEAGLILRYRPGARTFERLATPEAITLFGVWAGDETDVWYAGGVPGDRGVVWHDDGATIAPISDPPAAVFKVHGVGGNGVWAVGERGMASRWNGTTFEATDTDFDATLFTAHGIAPDQIFAVGGASQGKILAWNGAAWLDETPPGVGPVNGVYAVDRDRAYAAGFNGVIHQRIDGVWTALEGVPTLLDLHAVWADERGGIWAVGGQLASDPPIEGVMVHYGEEIATGL